MTTPATPVRQGIEAVFPADEFDGRVARARTLLAERDIDVLIVTGPENIFYLTGQQTPGYYTYQALLLPADGDPVFIVRELEMHNLVANSFIDTLEVYPDNADPVDVTLKTIEDRGWGSKRFALDKRGWFLPIAVYEALSDGLGTIADGAGLIEQLRVVKSAREQEKIAMAAQYAEMGMRAGMVAIEAGSTENNLVASMMGAAIAAGCEYVGMEPLVSSGPRSGVPHGTWRRRRLEQGDPVFLEMAGCHDRYHATLMRSAWIGAPDPVAAAMMECCLEALEAALAKVRPGQTCADVHNACQAVVDAHGFTDNFRKRAGYSIGTAFAPDWGEGALLSLYTGVERELEPGMAFHIPPALRRYGEFTVGVSETVIVTETGHKVLADVPRELLII